MTHSEQRSKPCNNKQWQYDFVGLKSKIKQSRYKHMPIIPDLSYNSNRAYYGKTQYQYYCDFINGILKNIRRGEVDYCFYVYQIEELLKYEHDNLCAKYLDDDECFQVSLKTSR